MEINFNEEFTNLVFKLTPVYTVYELAPVYYAVVSLGGTKCNIYVLPNLEFYIDTENTNLTIVASFLAFLEQKSSLRVSAILENLYK